MYASIGVAAQRLLECGIAAVHRHHQRAHQGPAEVRDAHRQRVAGGHGVGVALGHQLQRQAHGAVALAGQDRANLQQGLGTAGVELARRAVAELGLRALRQHVVQALFGQVRIEFGGGQLDAAGVAVIGHHLQPCRRRPHTPGDVVAKPALDGLHAAAVVQHKAFDQAGQQLQRLAAQVLADLQLQRDCVAGLRREIAGLDPHVVGWREGGNDGQRDAQRQAADARPAACTGAMRNRCHGQCRVGAARHGGAAALHSLRAPLRGGCRRGDQACGLGRVRPAVFAQATCRIGAAKARSISRRIL